MPAHPLSARSRFAPRDATRLVCGVAVVALAWYLLGGCAVRQMIYPAPPYRVPSPPPAPLEEVDLSLSDGTRISAWHLPAGRLATDPGSGNPPRPAVLFFHGNGENLETMRLSGFFDDLAQLGAPGLALDYPGYGRSAGSPSEETLTEAADRAGDWLEERYPERARVVAGWSLGAAVAVRQAADAPDRWHGLVALSPWTSLPELARSHYPGWLVGLALHEKYDSLESVRGLGMPSLLAHGVQDRIIPVDHGRRLAASISDSAWLEIPGAGHNDLLARSEIWSEMSRFLDRIATARE